MMNRFVLLLLSALLCCGVGAVHGQSGPATTVAEVLRMAPGAVASSLLAAQLKGVVLLVSTDGRSFHLHDGSGTIRIVPPTGRALPVVAQEVTLEGWVEVSGPVGRTHLQVAAIEMELGDQKELPAAKPLALNSFTHQGQWVSVEGYVLQWNYSTPDLMIRLVSPADWTTTTVQLPDAELLPTHLHGAKLRLTGLNMGNYSKFDALHVPGIAQVEVLEPGTADIFDAPLVSIAEVSKRAVKGGQRLRVRGTLAATMEVRNFIITGEGGALLCYMLEPRGPEVPGTLYGDAGQWPTVQPGDVVELVGSVVDESPMMQGNGLSWTYVRVIGKGSVPVPEEVTIEQLLGFRNGDRWVTFEATIGAWMLQGTVMTYAVAGPHATILFGVRDSPPHVFPRDLHGARARLTGFANSRTITAYGCDFAVPNPSLVKITAPGREDPFDVKELSALDIASNRFTPAEHVKTKGVVVGREGGTLYVRGQNAALCVGLQSPWNRPASTAGCYFADCGPVPAVKVGDLVEIMGMPVRSSTIRSYAFYDLSSANVRVLGHQERVEAVDTTLAKISAGAHGADLVQTRGRLLALQHAPAGGSKWRTTMLLEADGKKLPVVHEGATLDTFDTLKVDDDVIVQAVVDRATPQSPRQLRMLAASDVKSLGESPAVLARKLRLWSGGTAAVFALFVGWIMVLRRSNRRKTETASLLEQKVEERTTELRQAQAGLEKALEQERELGELKSRFVSTVSHEFRTPLGVTMSAVEIIRHFDAKLSPERRLELCDEIHDATCGMAALMEQVLVMGRVEAGRTGFRPTPVDFEILAAKVIDESLSATNRKCPVHWEVGPCLNGAQADEALLRHILGNLIANAVKYSPANSEVMVRARREGDQVVCEVQDHGIGIPEKDRAHLFEAFHRCTNVGDIPGTGLGLAIVKRCVELHSGSIEVRSQVGQGTTFIVRIPFFEAETPPPEH